MQFTYRKPGTFHPTPQHVLPGAASLVVGAYDYQREAPTPPNGVVVGRVAAYSWEDHYAHASQRARSNRSSTAG